MICPMILLLIRVLLARENRKRDAEPVDDKYDDLYIEVVLPDGTRTERRVDKVRCPPPVLRRGRPLMATAVLISRNSLI